MTAERDDVTGDDKGGTQRQGPPIDMVRLDRSCFVGTDSWIEVPRQEDQFLVKQNCPQICPRLDAHSNAPTHTLTTRNEEKENEKKTVTRTKAPFARYETRVGLIEVPGRLRNGAQVIVCN